MQRLASVLPAVALFAVFLPQCSGQGITAYLYLGLTRLAEPGGAGLYEIRASTSAGGSWTSIVSPTGREYGGFSNSTLSGLSESQAFTELIGPWTITAQRPGPPLGPPDVYQMSVLPFSAADLFTATPTIVSPKDGASVPPEFGITIEWPEGVVAPQGWAVRSLRSTSFASVDYQTSAPGLTLPVVTTFKPGETSGWITSRVGTAQLLLNKLSATTTSTPNPYWKYMGQLTYANMSAPVTVTVALVPEPGTTALLVTALGWPMLRRRRGAKLSARRFDAQQ